MFQFTTTNVINSDKDLTTGKDLIIAGADSITIKRVGTFKKDNVTAIYKAVASDPENTKITIDLGTGITAAKGDVLNLSIYIGLSQGSADSRYSNDLAFKGKPFSVDFVWQDDAAKTAAKLVDTIKKYSLLVYGEKLLTATANTTFVTIEGINEYQRIKNLQLGKFDKSSSVYPFTDTLTILKTLDDFTVAKTNAEVTNAAEAYFVGKEGFGTYSFLLHNLRIPTSARTAAFAINQDETPIVGAKYNQYTIHYCADRGPLGMNAVGDTVKSVTTHVFYVKSDLATAFEGKLDVIGTLEEVKPRA